MKKTAKILSLVLALLMAALCCGCGGKDGKTLTVATNAEFPPFESLDNDGNFVGFDMDLMREIGKELGYEIKFQNMEFDGVVAAVNQGTCDVAISGLTINAKRKKSVDFSDAYYGGAAQILIVPANDTHYTGTTKEELDSQLVGQTIGVCSGFTGVFYANGDEEWGFKKIENATVKTYENISLAMADLKSGAISAFIMDDSPAKKAVEKNKADAKVIDVPLTVEEYGIAVEKGNTEMLKKINGALKTLKENGTYDKLLKSYADAINAE